MADEPNKPDEATQFGLTVEEFKNAAEATAQLRDDGKILLYYNRRSALRLIGDSKDLNRALAPGLTGAEADKRANEVLKEIQSTASHALGYKSLDRAVEALEHNHFDRPEPPRGRAEKAQRKEFRSQQLAKLQIASKMLIPEEVRERYARLRSSTGPWLEDLDYELVAERMDSLSGQQIITPFLRLRLRYSDIRQDQYLGGIFFFGGPEVPTIASSFDLECDLADIDLLLKRLSEAKQRLLKSETPDGEAEQ